jgi:MoaA/NifB/PqqE/SkfB family radical SAM enzyme
MKINNIDKTLMMIFLLEECNFSCDHCVRSDEPMDQGYRLTFQQLNNCLTDCRELQTIKWVHFSGGEPTLWTESDFDLVDLLLAISRAGFEPGFTTNGSYFIDQNKCEDLFNRYMAESNKPLHLYLSIDYFHQNFDINRGRATCLDNVIESLGNMPLKKTKLIDITTIVVISKDPGSVLPAHMINHYKSMGVKFNFIPLGFKGKAKAFGHLCPEPDSDKLGDLGAYQQFRQKQKPTKPKSNLVLIGDNYYLPEPWRRVAVVGQVNSDLWSIIDA